MCIQNYIDSITGGLDPNQTVPMNRSGAGNPVPANQRRMQATGSQQAAMPSTGIVPDQGFQQVGNHPPPATWRGTDRNGNRRSAHRVAQLPDTGHLDHHLVTGMQVSRR